MGETQTVFLVRENSREEILAALRAGRMYAVIGPAQQPRPRLERFRVWDEREQRWVEMGESATVGKTTRIWITITVPPGAGGDGHLQVIREGKVVKSMMIENQYDEIIELDFQRDGGTTYYRLDLDGRLASNPIFCTADSK